MSQAPLVSIGLPVYNGGRFLAQALDSLLGQTLGNLELVISDNASTDGTAEICRDYAARDARIRYIRQPENIGPPRNWNFVARQAGGRYFKWAAASDFCDPRMLEKCVAVLEADRGIVLCHGRTCMVDEITGARELFTRDVDAAHSRPSERYMSVVRTLLANNELHGVIRRDVLRCTSLISPRYMSADLVLIAELALHGRIVVLPEILFYRRRGRESSSSRLDAAELRAFYFPGSTARPLLPGWQRRIDLLRAILRAPIGVPEKLRTVLLAAHKAGRELFASLPAEARQFKE